MCSLFCDLYSILKGRRAAPLPGLSDLSHSHHSPAWRANRSASLLKWPPSFPAPSDRPRPQTADTPTPRVPHLGLAGLSSLFNSCFLESCLFFVLFCCILNVFSFVCVYNDEGNKALSPKTAAQAFLDDPHHSVRAGRIRVRGVRRDNMRMVRGQRGTI